MTQAFRVQQSGPPYAESTEAPSQHQLPRVAIVSLTELGSSSATANLLASLFEDWAPDSIFQISTVASEDEVSLRYPESFQPISLGEQWLSSTSGVRRTLASSRLGHYLEFICGNVDVLCDELQRFQPDVIYTRVVGQPFYYVELPRILASRLNVPLICHVMDDYEKQLMLSPDSWDRLFLVKKYQRSLRKLLTYATTNIAISQNMAEVFKHRYKRSFEVIHNGIKPDEWVLDSDACSDRSKSPSDKFHVVYAGSLNPTKEYTGIKNLVDAIHNLNIKTRSDYELTLNVQPDHVYRANQLTKNRIGTTVQAYLPIADYRLLLQTADALMLIRNFDEVSRAYTELSFNNKLPEYMASGTPIITVGPVWSHSVQYLARSEAAMVVTDDSPAAIELAILRVERDRTDAYKRTKTAKTLAASEFNMQRIRADFRRLVIAATKERTKKGINNDGTCAAVVENVGAPTADTTIRFPRKPRFRERRGTNDTVQKKGRWLIQPGKQHWVADMFRYRVTEGDTVTGHVTFVAHHDCDLSVKLCRDGATQFEASDDKVVLYKKGTHTVIVSHSFKSSHEGVRIQIHAEERSASVTVLHSSVNSDQ
jgi:glycosyltransferase involved in cell wall biosynthesis